LLIEEEYHGYILRLTNVKTSPNKVRYFNAIMHDGANERTLVSYKPELHNTMEAARVQNQPVQLRDFLEKEDQFRGNVVLTLNDKSTVEYSTRNNIPFANVKSKIEKFNTFATVKQVLEEACVDDNINIMGHITLNSEIQELNTKYGLKRKRDVVIHDDSSELPIKLSLWNNLINMVPAEGSYKFQDLRVKSYNGKYLTTNALTIIAPSTTSFKPIEMPPEPTSCTVPFPAETIDKFEEVFFCKKCQHHAIASGAFVICSHCGCKSLCREEDKRFDIKLSFKQSDESIVSLTLPHAVFKSFESSLKKNTTQPDIEFAILSIHDYIVHYCPQTNIIKEINSI